MRLTGLALAFSFSLTLSACCSSTDESPSVSDSGGGTPEVPVTYDAGFFNPEKDDTGLAWRWMSEEGVVHLPNTGKNSVLHLTLAPAIDKAKIRIDLNGAKLDEFSTPSGKFEKVYKIPANQQGASASSELRITTNQTLVTKHDPRHLGLRIFGISWRSE